MVFAGVCAHGARAQFPSDEPQAQTEESPELESGHYEEFAVLKAQADALLEENKDLTAQYEALQSEFFELQETADQYRQEIQTGEEELEAQRRASSQEKMDHSPADEAGRFVEDRILEKEIDANSSLEELQLYDLYYQRKDLESQLQERRSTAEEIRRKDEAQLSQLKDKFQERLDARQGPLERQIADLDRQNQELRRKIFALRREAQEPRAEE